MAQILILSVQCGIRQMKTQRNAQGNVAFNVQRVQRDKCMYRVREEGMAAQRKKCAEFGRRSHMMTLNDVIVLYILYFSMYKLSTAFFATSCCDFAGQMNSS